MINPNKVGLAVGAVFAAWHLCWSILVLLHWAQSFLDFIFWAHMIQPVYVVKPFDIRATAALIAITFVIGYVFGFIGALIWNRLHRS